MEAKRVGGVIIPMVTPIHYKDSDRIAIDTSASQRLVDEYIHQEAAGALFVFGKAGACDLGIPLDARMAHVEKLMNHVDGRLPVVVGVSHEIVEAEVILAQHAEQVKADAIVLLLNQANASYEEQVSAILSATHNIPLILYNNPFVGKDKRNLQPDQVGAMMRQYPGRIVGLKESSGNEELFIRFIHLQKALEKNGTEFKLFMGDATKISWIVEHQEQFDFKLPGAVPVEANDPARVEGYLKLLQGLPADNLKYLTIPAVIELLCDQDKLDPLTLAFWNGLVKFN